MSSWTRYWVPAGLPFAPQTAVMLVKNTSAYAPVDGCAARVCVEPSRAAAERDPVSGLAPVPKNW
ncbi:MAG: hypothetical protein HY079_05690 [Elusimicrobia bacterium]|nr:hypothetical protein [Elusimicrobiota bacterium]